MKLVMMPTAWYTWLKTEINFQAKLTELVAYISSGLKKHDHTVTKFQNQWVNGVKEQDREHGMLLRKGF